MQGNRQTIFAGVLVVASLALFSTVLARATLFAPTDEAVPAVILGEVLGLDLKDNVEVSAESTSLPARLQIPKLDIDAKVQYVGLTKKGNMAAPNNFTDVGWYKYGTVPGEEGSAVIAGHVDNGIALPAIFNKLDDLAEGDDIYVETSEGTRVRFIVKEKNVYDFDEKVDMVFNQKDASILRLITCAGVWVPKIRTHDKRLVVTAVKAKAQISKN